jgi:hypothetical protein
MEWPREGARGIIKAWWAMAEIAAAMTTSSVHTYGDGDGDGDGTFQAKAAGQWWWRRRQLHLPASATASTITPWWYYESNIIIDQWQLNYGTGRRCVDVDELRPWLTSFPLDEIIFI